jgi:predicted NBD/HSP70 family sugar kinase
MLKKTLGFVSAAAVIALGACSDKQPEQASASQVADKLDQAAAQSDPTAAAVIDKRADNLRNMGTSAPDANAYAQETMRQAGAAASQSDAPAQ